MERNDLILVDILGREIGTCDKLTAHTKKLLHKAFSVFLVDGNKILIQKRALGKYHSGGLWANSCCSHPRSGEYLRDSAIARVKEELGVTADIRPLYSFVYYHEFDNGITEYENDTVFIGSYTGDFVLDPEEVSEIKWVDIDKLAQDLKDNPEKYAPWFLICCPEVIKHLKSK